MASNINNYSSNIDTNFPVQGQDNPSQGFRDNFAQIRLAFDTASEEISQIQSTLVTSGYDLPIANAAELGGVKIGQNVTISGDGTISVSTGAGYILPPPTGSDLGGVKAGTNVEIDPLQLLQFCHPTLVLDGIPDFDSGSFSVTYQKSFGIVIQFLMPAGGDKKVSQ